MGKKTEKSQNPLVKIIAKFQSKCKLHTFSCQVLVASRHSVHTSHSIFCLSTKVTKPPPTDINALETLLPAVFCILALIKLYSHEIPDNRKLYPYKSAIG